MIPNVKTILCEMGILIFTRFHYATKFLNSVKNTLKIYFYNIGGSHQSE